MPNNPSKLPNNQREEIMKKKLAKGESIETVDDMSDEYYDHLTNLMLQQADSELAGGFGYVPWIMKAPTTEEMLIVSNIVRDEVRHGRAMYRLLEDTHFGVDDWVEKMDFASAWKTLSIWEASAPQATSASISFITRSIPGPIS